MEDSENFVPSKKAREWSIALNLSNAALAFSLLAAPTITPILAATTIFALVKSQRIFSNEIKEYKSRKNIQANTPQNLMN